MVADSRMMTAFEYELLPETDAPTELIDGELIVSAEPTPRHQLVASRLQRTPELDQASVTELPRIVLEILSPASRTHDQIRKRSAYADRRIPEYWIIDPVARTLTVNIRDDRGVYIDVQMLSKMIPAGVFEGSPLDLEWIFGDKNSREIYPSSGLRGV